MKFVKPENNFDPIHGIVIQSIAPKALMGALKLKVFDMLTEGPLTAEAVAARLGAKENKLKILLEMLAVYGLLEKGDDGYANTGAAGEFLVSTAPLYQGLGMELTLRFIADVEDSIADLLTGKTVNREVTDDGWGVDAVMDGTAQDAMGSALVPVLETVAALPGFEDFRTLCDIGGNHGLYTMGVLDRNEAMSGVIYDLPHVAEKAQERCDAAGYAGRIAARGMDFRTDELPREEYDLVMISHMLYGFKDDLVPAATRIADGLKPGGWFVSHHYAGRDNGTHRKTKASLEVLTLLGGYPSHFIEKDELTDALHTAGFEDIGFRPVSSNGFGLITTARKKA